MMMNFLPTLPTMNTTNHSSKLEEHIVMTVTGTAGVDPLAPRLYNFHLNITIFFSEKHMSNCWTGQKFAKTISFKNRLNLLFPKKKIHIIQLLQDSV